MQISIPAPCTVSQDKMTATADGWHCSVCEKEVIDFSAKDDAAIMSAFENASPCGIFRESQLDRPLETTKAPSSCSRARAMLAAISVAMAGAVGLESCFMGKRAEPDVQQNTQTEVPSTSHQNQFGAPSSVKSDTTSSKKATEERRVNGDTYRVTKGKVLPPKEK